MPLTRVTIMKGRHSKAQQQNILRSLYEAMRETFDVPEDDLFMMLHEVEPWQFGYGRRYLGFDRSDALIFVQITCNASRTLASKKAFYARVVERLRAGGVRPDDVFISLLEVAKENWSFGGGLAQYA